MSTLIHCDGPGCTETASAVQARTYDWLRVEQDNTHAAHFHSRACLTAWSAGTSSTTTTVTEPAPTPREASTVRTDTQASAPKEARA